MLRRSALVLAAWLFIACESSSPGPGVSTPPPPPALDRLPGGVVLAWNELAYDLFPDDDSYNSLAAARIVAMAHLAQHDALAAIAPLFASYAEPLAADAGADAEAAVVAAAHAVLVAEVPHERARLDARLAEALATRPAGEAKDRGVALGARAAAAILALRAGDGSDTPEVGDHQPRALPGAYQYVAPYDFAYLPGWASVTPFALRRADELRPGAPPALDSEVYTAAFAEVKAFGGKQSELRSEEQSAYAKYWYETSELGWNRIARVVAAERELGLASTVRLFALLGMALSDAYVTGWDAKYHHDFWRPTTAIRAAESDGNPATSADPSWESAEITPPVPDYPSTHSALGGAAAVVLAAVFGDQTPFSMPSPSALPAGASRSFTSFSRAAAENADSRVRGGLHFRFSCDEGLRLGRRVGEHVLARLSWR